MNIAVQQNTNATSIPVKVINGYAHKFIGGANILRLRIRKNMTPQQRALHDYQMKKFFNITVECGDN